MRRLCSTGRLRSAAKRMGGSAPRVDGSLAHAETCPANCGADERREALVVGHAGLVKFVIGRLAIHLPAIGDRNDLLPAFACAFGPLILMA